MVKLEILKEKTQTISTVLNITKVVGVIIVILNILGIVYSKIELTISLSLIFIGFLWLWALDTQVGRMERLLNKKGILKDTENKMGKNKKGSTQVGKIIIWILLALLVLFIISRFL